MKAAILEEINGPLTIGEVTLTDLLFGQVLVKILVSGICGSQLQEIAGNKGNAKFVPHLLGHEGCGIVEDIGPGVTKVKKGDKVVMHWRKGDGIESDFPTYMFKGKPMKSGKVTTLSEYSIVSENRITPVPHDTPNELCALLGCVVDLLSQEPLNGVSFFACLFPVRRTWCHLILKLHLKFCPKLLSQKGH